MKINTQARTRTNTRDGLVELVCSLDEIRKSIKKANRVLDSLRPKIPALYSELLKELEKLDNEN